MLLMLLLMMVICEIRLQVLLFYSLISSSRPENVYTTWRRKKVVVHQRLLLGYRQLSHVMGLKLSRVVRLLAPT